MRLRLRGLRLRLRLRGRRQVTLRPGDRAPGSGASGPTASDSVVPSTVPCTAPSAAPDAAAPDAAAPDAAASDSVVPSAAQSVAQSVAPGSAAAPTPAVTSPAAPTTRRAWPGEPSAADEASLAEQSRRLTPFRDRLLRRVSPGLRGATLDLACGFGALAAALAGRVRGPVIALDVSAPALLRVAPPALRVQADAAALPFPDATFDLVVSQHAWLWFPDRVAVAREIRRVLAPGGVLLAIGEPDLGGAIEHPASLALAPAWRSALLRAGADPLAARSLPGLLRSAGLHDVRAEIFGELAPPADLRASRRHEADLLLGLNPTPDERAQVERALAALHEPEIADDALAFVPTFGILAWR